MKTKQKKAHGFTLLELLITITTVGVLSSIALPHFVTHKTRAFDARVKSVVRNVASAQEAYFIQNESYVSCTNQECVSALPQLDSIESEITLMVSAADGAYTIEASHRQGSGETITWPL